MHLLPITELRRSFDIEGILGSQPNCRGPSINTRTYLTMFPMSVSIQTAFVWSLTEQTLIVLRAELAPNQSGLFRNG